MRIVGATLAILIAATGGQNANERLAVRVTPNVSNAPSTVTVKAIVERNAANRYLEVEADSGDFYRSRTIQLDGDRAPLVTEIPFRNLPGGEYAVAATLHDSLGGRTVVRRTVLVLSRSGEQPWGWSPYSRLDGSGLPRFGSQ